MENFHLQTFFYMRLLLQTFFLSPSSFFTCIQFFSVITASANNLSVYQFILPVGSPLNKDMFSPTSSGEEVVVNLKFEACS